MQDGKFINCIYARDDQFQVKDGLTKFVLNLKTMEYDLIHGNVII